MRQHRSIRVTTAALAALAAGLVSAVVTLPAEAADTVVATTSFEDGTWAPWVQSGNPTLSVVDDGTGTNKVLDVANRAADYDGIQTPASYLTPGATYRVSADVRLAPGTVGTASVHLVSFYNDGSDHYGWLANSDTVSADAWTPLTGTFALPAGASTETAKVYFGTSALSSSADPYGYQIDNVVVSAVTVDPPPSANTVWDLNFDASTYTPWTQSGGPDLTYVDDGKGGKALSITRRASYDSIQSPAAVLEPGVEYTFSLRAKVAADSVGASEALRTMKLVSKGDGYATVTGTQTVLTGDWQTITGTYAIPANADPLTTQVYIGIGPYPESTDPVTILVDDLLVTSPIVGVNMTFDFENGVQGFVPRNSGGTPTVDVTTAEFHGGAQALLVSNRAGQGDGTGYDFTADFVVGQTYDITAWVKMANGVAADDLWLSAQTTTGGTDNFSTVGQFAAVGADSWTKVTATYTMAAVDSVFLYFETNYNTGSNGDFLVDDVSVVTHVSQWDNTLTPLKSSVDFPIGVAIDSRETAGAPSELLVHHFDQVTSENFMKPEAWYSGAGADTFRTNPEATGLMDFAAANGLRVYGHTLAWHSQTPAWFFQDADGRELTSSDADKAILRQRLQQHITKVAEALSTGGGYGLFGSDTNPLVAFDVVNEVVADQASAATNGLRDSRWYQILGEEFIDLAFQYADTAFNDTYAVADANPVTLFINDYNTEDSGKAQRIHALVERLISRGVPVDGIGHQFHVNLNRNVGDLGTAIDTFADLVSAEGAPFVQAVTELDVTVGTPVTTRNLIEQGYYYKAVFDMLRAKAGEIFSATVWGLTDGRSWRSSSGAPLLFDDDLTAKPAYYGIADVANLPVRQQAANVFRADVTIDDDVLTDPVWTDQPLIDVGTAARFQLRWAPDHVTAYVTVDDATSDATDAVTFTYRAPSATELQTVTVNRADADTATRVVSSDGAGWSAVVQLPLLDTAAQGSGLRLDVDVTDGAANASWNDADGLGTLTFVERSSVVEVVETDTAPTIDGEIDAVWADAQTATTAKFTSGTEGAQALVRTLWKGDTLYVLMRVSDPVLDDTASNPWEEDSVEIYVDRGNVKNGAYRNQLDTQYRVNFNNVRSFGSGDEAWQDASLVSETSIVTGGYLVEAAIDLNGEGGLGSIQGLDFQVNNASNGARTSIANWAEPTGTGYQSTARWGTGKLVAEATEAYAPGVTTVEPFRAVSDTQVPRNTEICVPMAGENGVPADATGLIVNVTTVRPNGPGFVVVYPGGADSAPSTSTANFEAGQDVANTTFVGIGADGTVCYKVTGPTQVGILMDVQGYTTASSGIVLQEPQRILDTRPGATHIGAITGPVDPQTAYTVMVAGVGGVPADATAVIVNATVQGPTAIGNLRLYPAGGDVPNASTINYAPGVEKANTTIVQLPASGEIAFYSDTFASKAASPVNVILDVVGYMTAATTYTPVTPERVIDTRGATGPLVGALQARRVYPVQLADLGPVPTDATSVMLNVTAVGPTTNGNLRVFPDPSGTGDTAVSGASSVNYVPGRDIPNMVVVDVPMSGTIAFYSDQPVGGTVHLVVDVVGYVAPALPLTTEQLGPWEPNLPVDFVPGGATSPVETPVSAARGTGNRAALTFDDGPMYAADTNELLDFLQTNGIHAVFCVIGDNIQAAGGAAILQRMVADGHTLCNHGTSYADMGSWSQNQVEADLMANLEIIRTALGDPNAKVPYFRAPNGSWGDTEAVAVALGMQPLGLGNVIMDWEDATQNDVEALKTNLRAAITPGAVVLAHVGGGTSRANTVDAVQVVVAERLAAGWTFTLPVGGVEPVAPGVAVAALSGPIAW